MHDNATDFKEERKRLSKRARDRERERERKEQIRSQDLESAGVRWFH
jgi:hypothetical protein